jgi:hypothetical protein
MKGKIFEYSVFDYDIDPDVIGLDFGYNDPTSLVYVKEADIADKKDLYIQEMLYRTQMTGNDIVNEMNAI